MKIPAYQIQNVLRLYFKQLGEGKILEKTGTSGLTTSDLASSGLSPERPRVISSEGTRQAIIDKVAAGIVEKIIAKAAETDPLNRLSGRQDPLSAGKPGDRDRSPFTYLLIDRNDTPAIRTAKEIQPCRNPLPPGD